MKTPLLFIPFIALASCSDLTPDVQKDLDPPSSPSKKIATPEPLPPGVSAPEMPTFPAPKVTHTPPAVTFMDPVTTSELLTDEKKKTVTGPASKKAEPTNPEKDSVIEIDLPKTPKLPKPLQNSN